MKYSLLVLIVLVVIVTACNKDTFTTEPQVAVKSISPETVFNGDVINMKAKYTDDEGDLDSAYIVYKWYKSRWSQPFHRLIGCPVMNNMAATGNIDLINI